MNIRNLKFAAVAVLALASGTAQAVTVRPAPVIIGGGGGGPGPAPAVGIIATAGILALYDLLRRTSCSGDFLALGGPGFGQAIRPTDNVLTPVCPPAPTQQRRRR